MRKSLLFASVACSAAVAFANWNSPAAQWVGPKSAEGVAWHADAANWKITSDGGTTVRPGATFPEAGDCVRIESGGTYVYLEEGESVSGLLGLNASPGFGQGLSTIELRKGSYVGVRAQNIGSLYEGVKMGDDRLDEGRVFVKGGCLDANGIVVGGGSRNTTAQYELGKGWLRVTDGGVVSNSAHLTVGAGVYESSHVPATSRVDFVSATYVASGNRESGDVHLGSTADTCKYRVPMTLVDSWMNFSRQFHVRGSGVLTMENSHCEARPRDWYADRASFQLTGAYNQTNRVSLVDSTLIVYRPEWDPLYTKGGENGYRWAHWARIDMKSQGYSEFVQKDSVVTNVGVWFWPASNAGDVYPVKPPRYVVDGGELYVYNTYMDQHKVPDGMAAMGFAAAANAPNSGTVEFLNAARVSFSGVNTNLLTGGNINTCTFGISTNRPHLKFTLTKKGHRPAEIRMQTEVMGMYSFEPQGGLQVVQTNRFALLRHKTASATMTTCAEPQFRAPNTALWTTGGFADVPREWGVTLKPEAEIANGEDLGSGVASGWIRLPRCKPATVVATTLRLKMSPGAKTLAEVAADLTAAGYPATLEGTDEVVVDLLASGMLEKGDDNRVLLDFNAPQDAVAVRDNAKTANARILKATAMVRGCGLIMIVR